MSTKIVIHIVGAASSKSHCLDELNKKVDGAALVFSYENILKSKKTDLESECLNWIHKQVKDNELILTYGLPVQAAKTWLKKAYPNDKFKHLIWEVHHKKKSEHEIVSERSWNLLIDGILSKGKEALERGIPIDHDLIKDTPLRIAMEYVSSKKDDIPKFLKSLTQQLEWENLVHLERAVICPEAFGPKYRESCISKISQLVTNTQQRGRA